MYPQKDLFNKVSSEGSFQESSEESFKGSQKDPSRILRRILQGSSEGSFQRILWRILTTFDEIFLYNYTLFCGKRKKQHCLRFLQLITATFNGGHWYVFMVFIQVSWTARTFVMPYIYNMLLSSIVPSDSLEFLPFFKMQILDWSGADRPARLEQERIYCTSVIHVVPCHFVLR
jgi:hypothetical protein